MKYSLSICFLIISFCTFAQTEAAIIAEIEAYQASESEKFSNPETSILLPEDLKEFEKLDYFPVDLKYRVTAKFVRTPQEKPFLMPTTTTRLPEYVKYGEVRFKIEGKPFQLNLYQSTTGYDEEGYENYLFLPFTDETNGETTYGGGRFLDARIPEGDTIILDFNKAYNPYCAYSPNYSCPIPPKENDLKVAVKAGVRAFKDH